MNIFINPKQVTKSINYFKKFDLNQRATNKLGTFLVLKQLGISITNPYHFNDKNTAKDFSKTLWTFGGIFDQNEVGDSAKHSVIFPTCLTSGTITSNSYFNGSSSFNRERGRIKDSMRNQHPRIFKQTNPHDEYTYTLVNDYIDVLRHQVLNGEKISFFNFAIWLLRFQTFPVANSVSNSVFTRIIRKYARNYIHLNKIDFNAIFNDDFPGKIIEVSNQPITGKELRATIGINNPDIKSGVNTDKTAPSSELIDRFSNPTGDNPTNDEITKVLNLKKQILLVGVPGVGKTYYINSILNKFKDYHMVQFHPDFSYQDFIGGDTLNNGTVTTQKGIFLKSIEEAKRDPNNKYLFVIDEINRGNIPEIFGETIEILDRKYTAQLAQPIDKITKVSLPDNLYIIGAMNNNDRSVASLDFALRRRFAFIELKPNYELVSLKSKYNDFDMGAVLETINDRLIRSTGDPSKMLGQSYFLKKDNTPWTDEEFKIQFNTMILPTIKDYAFNDISIISNVVGSNLSRTLFDTNEFKKAFAMEFSSMRVNK